MKKNVLLAMILGVGTIILSGCGTFRGIPSHGGGKRFAIEQELISATARAVAKDIDIEPLLGKRCSLFVVTIGDQGAGNLLGGRYAFDASIRSAYINAPIVKTMSRFPTFPSTSSSTSSNTGSSSISGIGSTGTTDDSTSTTGTTVTTVTETIAETSTSSSSGSNSSTTTATTASESTLITPDFTKTLRGGEDTSIGGGVTYQSPVYRSEAFVNPNDSRFLNAVIHEAFALQGVQLFPPEQAEVDIYVTVDVFGTVRSRTEFHVFNQEKLVAKTAMQVSAFDRFGNVVLQPVTASFEASYTENYMFWMGPVKTYKKIQRAKDLLVDFHSIRKTSYSPSIKRRQSQIPAIPENQDSTETRPKSLTVPLPTPDPSKLEDL